MSTTQCGLTKLIEIVLTISQLQERWCVVMQPTFIATAMMVPTRSAVSTRCPSAR